MALLEIGNVLVGSEELTNRSGEFDAFARQAVEALRKGKLGEEAFFFEAGPTKARDLLGAAAAPTSRSAPDPRAELGFEPIGTGRPLSIEILHVYTGDLPMTLLRRETDVLVTSAARPWTMTDAAPRALNRLARRVGRRQVVDFPTIEPGSRLAFYSKALTEDSTSITIEMVADSFPDEAFEQLSGLLGGAAGLPVFSSASLYLTAGSLLTRAIGALGEKLTDGKPFLSDTLDLSFSTAGMEVAQPRKALLVARGGEAELQAGYGFPDGGYELVSRTDGKTPYRGPTPYVAVAIDGRKKPSYERFAPALATAALLDRFHHVGKDGGRIFETLSTALELYNDMAFAEKAKRARGEIAGSPEGSEERGRAEKLLAACLENIRNDAIRSSVGT